MEKQVYVAPKLEYVGSFEELTQAGSTGPKLDANMPQGTPVSGLTFS